METQDQTGKSAIVENSHGNAGNAGQNIIRTDEDRMWVTLCHLTAFSGFVIPFGNFLGPLVIWLSKRDSDPAVDTHGKANLNFQMTAFLIIFVLGALGLLAMIALGLGTVLTMPDWGALATSIGMVISAVLGAILFGGFMLWCLALVAINSIRAYDGKAPWYKPMIRFIR